MGDLNISIPIELLATRIVELLKGSQTDAAGNDKQQIEVINTDQLCERLDISLPTAIKLRKRGRIPFFNIGTAVRYNWPEVVKALSEKEK